MPIFALSSVNKDQPRDLYNYLHQNVITAISNLECSTLGGNLRSHQVDMYSALIAAEAVENNEEHLVPKNVSSITLLV